MRTYLPIFSHIHMCDSCITKWIYLLEKPSTAFCTSAINQCVTDIKLINNCPTVICTASRVLRLTLFCVPSICLSQSQIQLSESNLAFFRRTAEVYSPKFTTISWSWNSSKSLELPSNWRRFIHLTYFEVSVLPIYYTESFIRQFRIIILNINFKMVSKFNRTNQSLQSSNVELV